MSQTIRAIIPGPPRSWERNTPVIRWKRAKGRRPRSTPRAVVATGWEPYAQMVRVTSQEQYKQMATTIIRAGAVECDIREAFAGPVRVVVDFVFPRTKGKPRPVPLDDWHTGSRLLRSTKQGSDIDRLQGLLLDALTASHVLYDDGQVCEIVARKWWAARDEQPHVDLRMESIGWSG